MRRRARAAVVSVPLPLALLLAVATAITLAWSIAEPPLQGPDELGHYAYTERIVEQRTLPWHFGDPPQRPGLGGSTALLLAQKESGLRGLAGHPGAKDSATSVDEARFDRAQRRLADGAAEDGGYVSAMDNPPAYYLYQAIPYLASSPGTFFTRSAVMRWANLPLLVVVVVCTWLLSGVLFGPRRWLQTLATGVVALNPQLTSVFAGINADALLIAAYAAALYVMALVLVRGATRRRLAALGALCLLAGLTHGRGLPLLAPALATLAVAWWRASPRSAVLAKRSAIAVGAGAAVAALVATFLATRGDLAAGAVRGWLSYLWQFYLPRPEFMTPTIRPDWTVRDAFVERFWGTYGQLDTFVAPGVVDTIATLGLVGTLALGAVLVARWRAVWRARALAGVLVLAVVTYILVLHVAAWRGLRYEPDDPVLTGRYLLVFIPLFGCAVAALVSWVPRRAGPAVAGGLLSGALALQLAGLGALIVRMHG